MVIFYDGGGSFATLCFATLCNVYYKYWRICDVIPPNVPSQEVGHWSVVILHMARVFIAPTPGVPFKISMPPTIQPAKIEYAHNHCHLAWYCVRISTDI